MAEVGAVIGALRDAELELFRRLGRLAPSFPVAAQASWASAGSLRAAWRASQLEPLLPVSTGLVPSVETAGLGEEVPGEEGPGEEVPGEEILAAVAQRYHQLAEAYRFRLEHLSAAADGAVERCLQRVLTDLEREEGALHRVAKPPGRCA